MKTKSWLDFQVGTLNWFAPFVDLLLRLWVANVFFKSGLTKISSWGSTITLFENEYQVPILSPEIAAYLATGVELIIPVLLVFGLGTRLSAIILFVFNIIAVISYPDLGEVGRETHIYWGIMLLAIIAYGPQLFTLDFWINKRRTTNFPVGEVLQRQ